MLFRSQIANKYVYDPFTRRLSDVNADSQVSGRPLTPFHRLHYSYDKVGNVTRMTNNVSVRPHLNAGVFVGPLDVSYTYDNLYQLRSTNAKYRPHVAYGYQWADTLTYDETANIKTKAQTHDRLVWDTQTVNTNDTNPVVTQLAGSRFDHNTANLSYTLAYKYTGSRPHAASSIDETPGGTTTPLPRTYSYDANGNNTGHTFQLNTRQQIWDDENRLKEVKLNNGTVAQFRYDDTGERTKKYIPGSGAGDSWYVNQFFVLLPGNRPTKHIYAGETRIASKTDTITLQTPVLHFYHPDHLGTTSYISDKDQNLVQHERYFAFGELWRGGEPQEETDLSRPIGDRRDWLFTGKEWDTDTKLYYFGARYFDPHTSVWQGPDPILASYMKRGPAGASAKNLGLYSYGWNNPIVVRDPDGRESFAGAAGRDIQQFQTESKAAQGVNASAIANGAPHGFGVADQFAKQNEHLFYAFGDFETVVRNRLGANPTRQLFMQEFGSQFSVAQARVYQLFGEFGLSLAMLPMEGPGLLAPGIGRLGRVATPHGTAIQHAAVAGLRAEAAAGRQIFRGGNFGKSLAGEGQFWGFESPLTPGFAERIGAATLGRGTPDFVIGATVRPGTNFITRFAPPFGRNVGGAPEAVLESGGARLTFFHMP